MTAWQRIRIVVEEYRELLDNYEERQDHIIIVEEPIDAYQLAVNLSDHAHREQRAARLLLKVGD